MDWNWNVYLRISALMFMEFAVWGAWMPVLALRLLGPLKLNGKQTGWIYATFPLACIFAPLASGYLADRWFNAEWVILALHAVGAVLLFLAAKQTKFWGMFWTMFAYSICYTATLPLVNSVLFQNISEKATLVVDLGFVVWPISVRALVFLWAPVAWALIGFFLTRMRQVRKAGGDGPDALYLAAILSAVAAAICLIQPPTLPHAVASVAEAKAAVNPMFAAIGMLGNTNYLIFMLIQLVVSGMMQFYFLGTGQFMQDRGISGKNISGLMGIAQAVQAAATIFLLGLLIEKAGFKWTFAIGALSWAILFAGYVASKRGGPVILFQAFHGFAYVFFVIGGQMFVGKMAPAEIGASAQSLIFIATSGIGLFLGTQLAGFTMERNSVGGKFQWSKIWSVPLAITLAGAIVFAVAFKVPAPADFQPAKPHPQKAVAVVP